MKRILKLWSAFDARPRSVVQQVLVGHKNLNTWVNLAVLKDPDTKPKLVKSLVKKILTNVMVILFDPYFRVAIG